MSSEATRTHCPYCSLQCGISLVAGDRPAVLQPQPDSPPNLGGLCPKGWNAASLLDHPQRLLHPLVREVPGDRSSPFREASWDEALDLVAAAITRSQDRHGRDSVGCFGGGGLTNEKAYAFGKFARVALRTAAIDAGRAAGASHIVVDPRRTALAAGSSAMILTARGAEQHSNSTDTAQAFLNLALALGLPSRPYSGYGTITGQGNGQGGREHGQKADQLPGYRKLADPADRAHVAAVWGIDPDELPRPELSAYEMLDRYETNHITLHAGVRVTRIDRHAQVVLSDDGQVTPYDDLIIATGSHSFLSPMGGMYVPSTSGSDGRLLPGVFPFRTNDDTRGMIAHATHDDHRRALVIGRGLLGLEAARGLQSHGLEVTVVHSPGHLMNAQLGPEGGAILRRSMEALGIRIVTGTRTTAVWGPDRVRGVRLKDGTELECDLIVVAAGIRPNTEVAVTSGLAVERAIVVDDQMRVADEDPVYTVGECVQDGPLLAAEDDVGR